MGTRAAANLSISLLLILSGCRSVAARAPDEAVLSTPLTPTSLTTNVQREPTSGSTSSTDKTQGHLDITLVDQNNNHPADIPVAITGPKAETKFSDAHGVVQLSGPSGSYAFKVLVGCADRVIVSFGQTGKGYILKGQTAKGTLSVSWHHRIGPGDATFPSEIPHWIVGDTVDVAYDVIDRCTSTKAPSSSMPTFVYQPSGNVQVIGDPSMAVDENSQLHVKVRCLRQGPMNLFVVDQANAPDRTDLVSSIFFDSANKDEVRGECRNPGPTP